MTDGGGLRLVSVAFGRHIKRRYVISEPQPGALQRQTTRYTPMTLTRRPVVQSIARPTPARVAPVIERVIEPARPAPVPAAEPSQSTAPVISTPEVGLVEPSPGRAPGLTGDAPPLVASDTGPLSLSAEPPAQTPAPSRASFTMEEVRRALQRPRTQASSQTSPGTQAARQAPGGARPSGMPPVTHTAPTPRARPVSQLYEQPPVQQAGAPAETARTPAARGPARAESTADRPTSQPAAPPTRRTAETQSTVSMTNAAASSEVQGPTTPDTVGREMGAPGSDAGTPNVPVRPVTDLADATAETPLPVEARGASPPDAFTSAQRLRRESGVIPQAEPVYHAPDEVSAAAGSAAAPDAAREQAARPADMQSALSDSQPMPEEPIATAPAVPLQPDAVERSASRPEPVDASRPASAATGAEEGQGEETSSGREAQSFQTQEEPSVSPVEPPVRLSPDVEAPAVTATAGERRTPGAEDAPLQSVPASFDLAEAYRAQLQRFATEARSEPEAIPAWPEPSPAQPSPSGAPPIEPQTLRESSQWVQEVPPAQTPPASAPGPAMSGVTPTSQHPPVRRQTGYSDHRPPLPATAEQHRLTAGALQPLPRQVLPVDQVVASMAAPTRVTRDRQDWPGQPIRRAEAPADSTRADSSTETAPAESEQSPQAERGPDIDELAERVFSKLRDRLRVERERLGGSRLR